MQLVYHTASLWRVLCSTRVEDKKLLEKTKVLFSDVLGFQKTSGMISTQSSIKNQQQKRLEMSLVKSTKYFFNHTFLPCAFII